MNHLYPNTNGHISPPKTTTTRKLIIFSGGSAANNLVDVFNEVINNNACSLTYLIPISDNGGSSSELIRVFGGPGIGDIRSKQLFSCWQLAVSLLLSHSVSQAKQLALILLAASLTPPHTNNYCEYRRIPRITYILTKFHSNASNTSFEASFTCSLRM